MSGQLWEVVGGAERGGILVRTGQDLKSWEAPGGRLAMGSIVREVRLLGERLCYQKVSGEGPQIGWVSLRAKGEDLLTRSTRAPPAEEKAPEEFVRSDGTVFLVEGGRTFRLKVVVHGPKDGGLARSAVVFCAGNPSEHFNSDHAGSPLALAVEQACCRAGVAVVRFDYRGVGFNSAGGSPVPSGWAIPTMEQSENDTMAVIAWVRKHVSRNIAVAGYSYGASVALTAALSRRVPAYVGFSIAPLVWKFHDPGPAQEFAKADTARHKDLDLPTLLVCGSKDSMSPLDEVQSLVNKRLDGGNGVTIRTLEGGNHALTGMEEEAAAACAEWVAELFG